MKTIEKKLKHHNMKVTPQRMAIYNEIYISKEHPNAEIIFSKIRKKYPNVSFDTVNRTLNTFAKIGLIKEVEGYGEPKRYDPDTNSHHHMRCLKCGEITDFYSDDYDKIRIPDNLKKKFMVTGKRVVLEGYCSKCR